VQDVTIMAMASLAETRDNETGNRDGSGYPEGLAGEAIPLSARLMALADVCADLEARLQAVVFP